MTLARNMLTKWLTWSAKRDIRRKFIRNRVDVDLIREHVHGFLMIILFYIELKCLMFITPVQNSVRGNFHKRKKKDVRNHEQIEWYPLKFTPQMKEIRRVLMGFYCIFRKEIRINLPQHDDWRTEKWKTIRKKWYIRISTSHGGGATPGRRTPRREPRAPGAPNKKTVKVHLWKAKNGLWRKTSQNLANNVKTWYNCGTNKPVLVRQRCVLVL